MAGGLRGWGGGVVAGDGAISPASTSPSSYSCGSVHGWGSCSARAGRRSASATWRSHSSCSLRSCASSSSSLLMCSSHWSGCCPSSCGCSGRWERERAHAAGMCDNSLPVTCCGSREGLWLGAPCSKGPGSGQGPGDGGVPAVPDCCSLGCSWGWSPATNPVGRPGWSTAVEAAGGPAGS